MNKMQKRYKEITDQLAAIKYDPQLRQLSLDLVMEWKSSKSKRMTRTVLLSGLKYKIVFTALREEYGFIDGYHWGYDRRIRVSSSKRSAKTLCVAKVLLHEMRHVQQHPLKTKYSCNTYLLEDPFEIDAEAARFLAFEYTKKEFDDAFDIAVSVPPWHTRLSTSDEYIALVAEHAQRIYA